MSRDNENYGFLAKIGSRAFPMTRTGSRQVKLGSGITLDGNHNAIVSFVVQQTVRDEYGVKWTGRTDS